MPRRRLIRPTTTGAGRLRFASLLQDCCVSCSCHRTAPRYVPCRLMLMLFPTVRLFSASNSSGCSHQICFNAPLHFSLLPCVFFPGCPLISFRLFSPADWNGEHNFAGIPIEPRVCLSFRIDQPPVTSTALSAREFATAYSHVFPLQIHTFFFFFFSVLMYRIN